MGLESKGNEASSSGFDSRYASRERIVRSYAAQDVERARNARMRSQSASQAYKENAARASERRAQREAAAAQRREQEALRAAERAHKREVDAAKARTMANMREHPDRTHIPKNRAASPMSTQESHDRARSYMEGYERARAQRDAFAGDRQSRTSNRELIDARGSIDSRAFNEKNELVGYSVDERDKPDPYLEPTAANSKRWRSHSSSDVSGGSRAGLSIGGHDVGFSKGIMSGQRDYTSSGGRSGGIPLFVKVMVPIIIVLIVILLVLIF